MKGWGANRADGSGPLDIPARPHEGLTGYAGTGTGAYTYDAFGTVRTHTGARTEWTFTGEQNDPTGQEYLRARHYDPASGAGRCSW